MKIDFDALVNGILDEYGTAEEEEVREDGYKFKNRQGQMINTLEYLEGREAKNNGRLYVKNRFGYD